MKKSPYIECGKIINTHGVRGAIKLESWCNTPEDLAKLKKIYLLDGGEYLANKVKKASVFKQFVIMELDGLTDIDEALPLKNKTVYAARKDFKLREGEFFICDLIGLDVIDADSGKVYGKLKETINRGASDIYVVDTPTGERMMPAVPEFVDRVDIESGIYVRVISGMLEDEE